MMQLVHGGDWAGYRAQYGQDALDFSANVSPLGLPMAAAWLVGKVQDLRYAIQDAVYG